ncbi:MAG: hypothetical protein QNJ57_09730 [Flavobacteriaceae bacterium]|nr:hypothetical protein [Flavobacteriaceae bacterium]
MLTVLIIIVAILIAAGLAYFIVNKTNKGTRLIVSVLLWLVIAFLGYKIYDGIMSPIEFNKEKKARYAKVIDRLKIIRDAQVDHKTVTGDYAKKFDQLVAFIDTAKFAVTETKNIIKTVNKGTTYSPIMIEVEERQVDTIGFKAVKDSYAERDYKNMAKVPEADINFSLETGYVEKVQGIKSPVFQAKVDKGVILVGLDRNLIKQEKEAFGGPEVSGEFISVGSLDDVKVNGNWPPFYDTGESKDSEG